MSLEKTFKKYPREYLPEDFSLAEWLTDINNVIICVDNNYGIFEFQSRGVYNGHYLSAGGTGQEIKKAFRTIANQFFEITGAEIIHGVIPNNNIGALRLSQWMGATRFDDVDTSAGMASINILTREAFMLRHGKD